MWKIIVLCATVSLAIAQEATFVNYKVFRITPVTKTQVEKLQQLMEINNELFWNEPSHLRKSVDLMVAPHKLPEFYEVMTQIGLPYQLHIENVQTFIDRTMSANSSASFDFKSYHTLEKIYENLDDLAKQYPDKVQVVVGGKTYEGRQIKGVKVSFNKTTQPGIFVEGGIHAREWISPATVMYILHQLLTSNDPDVRSLAESHDWYIFPSFNPDGYVYTHTKNRLWRKTRKPYGLCYGADPNRNWNYKWLSKGATSIPCTETYAGSEPFSEIEMKSMSEYIDTISDKFYAYISFHSYSQLLMFPYGYTTEHLDNYNDLYAIGLKSAAALKQRYGTKYQVGNVAEAIYECSGITVDYIRGIYRTPIVFTYELRDRGRYGFLLPPDQIIPSGEETLDSLVTMFKEAKALGYPKEI